MIIVTYMYFNKEGKIETVEAKFHLWQKALRFIKMVDGKRFPGHVLSWECDDPWDNEMLVKRHRLTVYRPIEE